jgi:hypothetical protein
MKEFKFKNWHLLIDPDRTAEILKNIKSDGESCSCLYCKNFISARDKTFKEDFLSLMKELGIDLKKDIHTSHIVELEDGIHLYEIDYYFAGEIISRPSVSEPVDTFNISSNYTIYRRNEFPFPVLVLECYPHVPWVLNEKS